MQHDFDNIRRGAVIADAGKTRVTMYLDNDVLEHFRTLATKQGRGYQTEINAALRGVMAGEGKAPTRAKHRSEDRAAEAGLGALISRLDLLMGRLDRLEQRADLPARYYVSEPGSPADTSARTSKRKSGAKPRKSP